MCVGDLRDRSIHCTCRGRGRLSRQVCVASYPLPVSRSNTLTSFVHPFLSVSFLL